MPLSQKPKPNNFNIVRLYETKNAICAWLNYPNSPNFEGNKIIVFEEISVNDLKKLEEIDPHFCDKHNHPYKIIARFRPTDQGWINAITFAKLIYG